MMATSEMDLASRIHPELLSTYRALPPWSIDPSDLSSAALAVRRQFNDRRAEIPPVDFPPALKTLDRVAPGMPGAPDVMVRLYVPDALKSPAPALYWVHGGGMIMGSVQMYDAYCAELALHLNALVASVDYRVAPEHPYPAAIHDCYAGLTWLAGAADELGVDRARIAVGGASAGGGLAAGLALFARDQADLDIAFQFLVYPMLDDRNVTPSSQTITDPRVWNRNANLAGWHAYLAGRAGADDVSPYAAPVRAHHLAGLPPAYINVGTADLFLDEDIAYAHALTRAGVLVELHVYPGVFHGAPNMAPETAIISQWRADERSALERGLNVRRE